MRINTMCGDPGRWSNFARRLRRQRRGFNLIELIVVLVIVVLLAALLLPAVRTAGPAVKRTQCLNNLRNIVLALHNYHDTYNAFPPAFTVDSRGKRLHSWRTLILPFLDEKDLYKKIDLSKPWDDPVNAEARESRVSIYLCPAAECPANQTTYLAILAPKSCLQPTRPRELSDVTGDPQQTLMVFEVDSQHAVPWMAPLDADETLLLSLGPNSKLSHAGGFIAAFVDCSVRFLPADMPAAKRRAMISIEGAKKIAAKNAPTEAPGNSSLPERPNPEPRSVGTRFADGLGDYGVFAAGTG